MFRRNQDEEIASQSQNSSPEGFNPQPQNPAFVNAQANPTAAFAPKPAAPAASAFGAFANAPSAEQANAEPKKPVTAPLTTSQVGIGSNNPQAIMPKPANAAFAAPTYNKVPAPTVQPAQVSGVAPSAAAFANPKTDGIEAERRLTVGYGITLTGEVSDCDRLVIYGKVNAKLHNVKFLQISDSGKFNGSAEIGQAEISGVFEGELKVANNITITSTGRVNGKITYGSIEIRPGGKFTGEIIEDATSANNQQSIGKSDDYSSNDDSSDYYGLNNSASKATSDKAA